MYIPSLPKNWLIHTIIYKAWSDETDDYGNPVTTDPIKIEHVRYDPTTVFSRDSTQSKIVAEGIVFVDTTHSTPLPVPFVEESTIEFEGKKLVIKKVITCYYPNENRIHHYELEVI